MEGCIFLELVYFCRFQLYPSLSRFNFGWILKALVGVVIHHIYVGSWVFLDFYSDWQAWSWSWFHIPHLSIHLLHFAWPCWLCSTLFMAVMFFLFCFFLYPGQLLFCPVRMIWSKLYAAWSSSSLNSFIWFTLCCFDWQTTAKFSFFWHLLQFAHKSFLNLCPMSLLVW